MPFPIVLPIEGIRISKAARTPALLMTKSLSFPDGLWFSRLMKTLLSTYCSIKAVPEMETRKKVQQIRVEKNIPFKQARELAIAEQAPSGPTMASVASAASTTVRGPQTRPRVRTSEAKCQTEFTWPDSEQFPVRLQETDNNTSQTSRSTNTSQTISDVRANPRQTQSGARTHSNERNSSKHSGGGSGRPRIQRPPSQTAGQAETVAANRFAALQSVHMEGVEATDTSIT